MHELLSRLPMTAAGYWALEDELKHRIQVERFASFREYSKPSPTIQTWLKTQNIRLQKPTSRSMTLVLPSWRTSSLARKSSTCRSFLVTLSNSAPR